MFDAHAHLQEPRLLDAAEAAGVRAVCVCATSPGDVAGVRALPQQHGRMRIVRAFGTHPWHAAGLATSWLEMIEAALLEDPSAAVGEIGLDGIRKDVPPEIQRNVFIEQLGLAARLRRPVVLHGARAWGGLVETLALHAPRLAGFMVHNFTGSLETLRELLRLGALISVSGVVCDPRNARARVVASAIPLPRLLVETDSPDMPVELPRVLDALAQLRGVASGELCHETDANARRFFGLK